MPRDWRRYCNLCKRVKTNGVVKYRVTVTFLEATRECLTRAKHSVKATPM